MKTINPILRIAIFALLCCAVSACSKDNGGSDNGGNGEESPYWKDAYKQHQLYGKVKTVKEWDSKAPRYYDWMEFDNRGNLLKNLTYRSSGSWYGLNFTYDGQNRLIKLTYGDEGEPEREVAEFGYNGKHNVYIPTNIYSMTDLRMYRGVSSVRYVIDGDPMIVANYKSGNGNQLVFEGTLGNQSVTITAECNANYPTKIIFQGIGEAAISFYNDGMPKEVVYREGDLVVTTKYTSVAGFMLMASQKEEEDGDIDIEEYEYNDKGYCIYEKSSYGSAHRYSYEYDNQGNWTKQVHEASFDNETTWNTYKTLVREYAYW